MLKEIGIIPQETVLHKYLTLDLLMHWVQKDSLSISFSKLDSFKDKREGIGSLLTISDINAILTASNIEKTFTQDGFTILDHFCLVTTFKAFDYENSDSKALKTKLTRDQLKNELQEFLRRKRDYHVSCFYGASSGSLDESRYMWDLYSGQKKWPAVRLSYYWKDLKKELEESDIEFEAGFVQYKLNEPDIHKRPLLYKDQSYEHEKEFRIYTEGLGDQTYVSYQTKYNLRVLATLNRILPRRMESLFTDYLKSLGFAESHRSPSAHRHFQISDLLEEELLDMRTIEEFITKL